LPFSSPGRGIANFSLAFRVAGALSRLRLYKVAQGGTQLYGCCLIALCHLTFPTPLFSRKTRKVSLTFGNFFANKRGYFAYFAELS
jgi:hypothetical protein